MNNRWRAQIRLQPECPGCHLLFDTSGRVPGQIVTEHCDRCAMDVEIAFFLDDYLKLLQSA